MKLPHFTVTFVILMLIIYVIGARYPALAKMAKLA